MCAEGGLLIVVGVPAAAAGPYGKVYRPASWTTIWSSGRSEAENDAGSVASDQAPFLR